MAGTPDPFYRIRDLFHFTNVSNIPLIKKLNGIYSTAKLNEMGVEYCSGGDESWPVSAAWTGSVAS